MSKRPTNMSVPGLLGKRTSFAPGLKHAVSREMSWDLRLGRVRKAYLYLDFSFRDFRVGTQD